MESNSVAIAGHADLDEAIEVAVCGIDGGVDRLVDLLARSECHEAVPYGSLASLEDACSRRGTDLAVVGCERIDAHVLAGIRSLHGSSPATRVVLACRQCANGDVRRALSAGARGIVLHEEIEKLLFPVLQVVLAGQVSVPGRHRQEANEEVLTTRQKQILGLVVMGMTNAEIASKLFLAESTVKSHLSAAFAKLGVVSRNEATALILDPTRGVGLGILTIPSERLATPGRAEA